MGDRREFSLGKFVFPFLASILILGFVGSSQVDAQLCPLTGCQTDNLYVLDFDKVRQYDSAGILLDANFITGLSDPSSIAFDSTGNLYVADKILDAVRQYDSAGALLDANFITGLFIPSSLAFDSAGNLYVSDFGFATVRQYDSAGALLDANFITGLSVPFSLAFDSAGNLYVANSGSDTVRQYDSAGTLLNANFITGLNFPFSIAFDSTGNLYVADNGLDAVRQYNSAGALLDANFAPGLISPTSIAFDSAGNLHVADNSFATVRQYNSAGTLLNAVFITGLINPVSLAFDVSPEADLSITKSGNADPVLPNDSLTYTVRVDNAGPQTAENVVVTETLPAGVTLVSTTGCTEDPNGVTTCSLGDIISGGFAEYTVEVTVNSDASGVLTNNVSVSSDTVDPNQGNNSTTEDTIIPEPEEKKTGGGGDRHDTRPTSYTSWETDEVLVTDAFGLNGKFLTLTDNYFTHLDRQPIPINEIQQVSITAYASYGVAIQGMYLGVPSVGNAHEAEVVVDAYYENGEITEVKIIQNTEVIDEESLSIVAERVNCSPNDQSETCYKTTFIFKLREELKDEVVAFNTIDTLRQNNISYLNEGFEITGDSINPMLSNMIPSNVRNEGLLQVTQVAKYSPYWVAEDGRTFEMNSYGSFKQINQLFERFQDTGDARTRMHSGYGGIIAYEQNRALEIFDSSNLVSELPDSFAYIYPETDERITDEMRQEMLSQEEIAKEILDEMDSQARNY